MRISPLTVLVVMILVMLATAGSAIFAYANVKQVVINSPIDLPAPPQINAAVRPTAQSPGVTATTVPNQAAATQGSAPATVVPANLASVNVAPGGWPDPKRFTILLMGVDARPDEKDKPRTDTMIVVSFDPIRKSAAMLSIPRDTYLKIPVINVSDRINNAYALGELRQYPGGGAKLAVLTAESLLGIRIDRYFMVNFQTFNKVIDAVGPITVCPETAIHDTNYPAYDSNDYITVDFKAGCQEVDSTRALEYSRVRHNAGDDFGRAARQQEVIKAVKAKVLSLGGVTKLLPQALPIWNSLKNDIKTDLTFDEIIQLAQAAQGIPNIESEVMSIKTDKGGQLMPATLGTGEQVLSPVYEDVHALVVRLFDAGVSGPANADPRTQGFNLLVSNGGGVPGMAKATADKLTAQGFHVVDVGNADAPGSYGKSEIRVYNKDKMDAARYLAQVIGVPNPIISQQNGGPSGVDIELIVGKDLTPK